MSDDIKYTQQIKPACTYSGGSVYKVYLVHRDKVVYDFQKGEFVFPDFHPKAELQFGDTLTMPETKGIARITQEAYVATSALINCKIKINDTYTYA